jgi:hypothetical protein
VASSITTIELRKIAIPRSRIIDLLEREVGKAITHEHRHFLELFENGEWITGRYEWTCKPGDPATLHFADRIEFSG